MNAARLALFVSLCATAALLGCNSTDNDEPDHAANAPAAIKSGYGYEFLTEQVHGAALPAATAPAGFGNRLAPELIRNVVRGALPAIGACNGAGEITVRFKIQEDGSVLGVPTTNAADSAIGTCVSQAIGALHFPASQGGPIEVVYPLAF